ncbi:hypothetical protein HDV64DRAFT_85041 [Trichoderma sp. TUCIM 5745]
MTAPTAHADAFDAPSSGSCCLVTAAAVAQTGREAKKKKRPHMKTTIFEVRGVGLGWELPRTQSTFLFPPVDAVRRPDYCVHLADIYLRRRTWTMMLIGHCQPWRGGSTVMILSDLPR